MFNLNKFIPVALWCVVFKCGTAELSVEVVEYHQSVVWCVVFKCGTLSAPVCRGWENTRQPLCGGKQTTVQAATSGSSRLEVVFFFNCINIFPGDGACADMYTRLGDPQIAMHCCMSSV